MANGIQTIVALLSVLSIAKGGATNFRGGIKLTNLTQTGFNQTTLSSGVKLNWSVHTHLLSRFANYRIRCSSTAQGQRNHYLKRTFDPHQQEAFIYGLLQNTKYKCCVELNLSNNVNTASCADIELISPTESDMTTEATSTERSHTELQGSTIYREEDVLGLYVVIGLLCVLLAVSVLGWLATGLVTYWKISMYKSRKVEPECEMSPHNHMHNPLYTSDYVPSNTVIGASSSNQQTTPHEYDYITVREPLERSNGAPMNNRSIGQHSRSPRMSIRNESALPLHYETMATYGNRIANRVDTTSPH